MADEFHGPVDKSEWGLRRGSGPKQYVKEDGVLRIVAVRDRQDDGINELLKGITSNDLRGRKSGISRFAEERGGWKIEGEAGAGGIDEYSRARNQSHKQDDYSSDSDIGEHSRGSEMYDPQLDVDLFMNPEPDYRSGDGGPHEEGDFVPPDSQNRPRPAPEDITDFEDLVRMDIFEELERGYGGNQDDVPRATTRQGPSPGDYHPPRAQPRTYRKKNEASVLDEIENLFEED